MTKNFTLKRFTTLCVMLCFCLFAAAEVVTIDFSQAPFKGLEGRNRLERAGELTVGGIKITNIKGYGVPNNITGNHLVLCSSNSLKLVAPEGKLIKKVVFTIIDTEFLLDVDPYAVAQIDDSSNKFFEWTTGQKQVTYKNNTRLDDQNISKLEVTLEPDPTTGIANVKTSLTKNYKVYNLNGVVVGTESTFKKLPKGVYIVNGKKVVKK